MFKNQHIKNISTRYILLFLFIYSLLIVLLLREQVGNDGTAYLGYLKGWMQGRYTYWYDVKDYLPDTFRNPGFPAVIAFLGLISTKILFLQMFQYVLYCLTLLLVVRLIENYVSRTTCLLIFAVLVLLNPAIPFHIVMIAPEIITSFLLVSWLYIRIRWPESWKKSVVIGLLFGFLFQVRPVVMFLPFIIFFMDWILQRNHFGLLRNASVILIYIVSMLPYGYWNYKTHGVFSVTSLEGGGGVLHLGYWCLKMPGYNETRYWYNGSPVSLINFAEGEEVQKNIRDFEREWDVIDSACAKYLTDVDRRNIAYMKENGERFITYNGQYTYEREKLLKKLSMQHYMEDWPYTIKTKLYMVFRLWVTGIQRSVLEGGDTMAIIKALIAPITTGITLLLAMIFIPLAMFKRKISISYWLPVLVTILYWGAIHVPFVIQARYTIPVRLLLIALTSVSIYSLFFNKEKEKSNN